MGVEIRPEPTSEEREAILRALAGLEGKDEPSEWWAAGVLEAVEEEDAKGQA
jgi:hypothetical protein